MNFWNAWYVWFIALLIGFTSKIYPLLYKDKEKAVLEGRGLNPINFGHRCCTRQYQPKLLLGRLYLRLKSCLLTTNLFRASTLTKSPVSWLVFFADWGKYSEYFLIPCVKIFDSQIALEFQSIWKAISRSESVINLDGWERITIFTFVGIRSIPY